METPRDCLAGPPTAAIQPLRITRGRLPPIPRLTRTGGDELWGGGGEEDAHTHSRSRTHTLPRSRARDKAGSRDTLGAVTALLRDDSVENPPENVRAEHNAERAEKLTRSHSLALSLSFTLSTAQQ